MVDEYVEYFSSVDPGCISDAMHMAGVNTGWTDGIYPTSPEMKICGRAFTVQFERIRDPETPSWSLYDMFDIAEPGDVIVVATYSNKANVGDNMMKALRNKGMAGLVMDGTTRDTVEIRKLGIPQFARHRSAAIEDYDFRITAYQVPVMIGGVRVHPGDYVVGDNDGLIVLAPCNAEKVRYQCEQAVLYEEKLADALERNVSMQEFKAIYAEKSKPRK